jgi:hypothetical protein
MCVLCLETLNARIELLMLDVARGEREFQRAPDYEFTVRIDINTPLPDPKEFVHPHFLQMFTEVQVAVYRLCSDGRIFKTGASPPFCSGVLILRISVASRRKGRKLFCNLR